MTRHTTHHTTHQTGIKTHHTKKTHRAGSAQGTIPTASAHQPGGVIRRGILTSFDPTTYTCSVLLLEATNTFLQNVPIAYHMDGTSALVNNFCAVLFFDEQNYTDALIIAIYPGAGVGSPTYLPGRLTFIPQFNLFGTLTIPGGNTNTYTVAGSNHIPAGALGILLLAYFTSATIGAFVQVGAHNASSYTLILGNMYAANGYINGSGVIPLSSDGKIDVKANSGDCVVTVYIHGYII